MDSELLNYEHMILYVRSYVLGVLPDLLLRWDEYRFFIRQGSTPAAGNGFALSTL